MSMEIYITNISADVKKEAIDSALLSERGKRKFEKLVNTNEEKAVQCATADLLLNYIIKSSRNTPTETCDKNSAFCRDGENTQENEKILSSDCENNKADKNSSFCVVENEFGKPQLKNGEFEFSVSHSHNIVAIIKADIPVGIDIELLRPVKKGLPDMTLNELELENYNNLDDEGARDRYFYRCFTEKESYLKFSGRGFSTLPREIKNYNGAKFVTKYLFLQSQIYCMTACAEDIKSLSAKSINFEDLLQ